MHFTHYSKAFVWMVRIFTGLFVLGYAYFFTRHGEVMLTVYVVSVGTLCVFLAGPFWESVREQGEKGQQATAIARALTDMVLQDEKTAMTFLKKIIATSSNKKFPFFELTRGMTMDMRRNLIPCVWLMQEEVRDRKKLTAEDHYKAAQELEHLDWLVAFFKEDLRVHSDVTVDISAYERVKTLERLRAVA